MELRRGDEVLTTNQDYPRMITTWQQRERRDGIVLKQLKFPVPPPSMDYLVKLFEDAITPRTKVIHICHMTNRTGQIFPVRKICELGRAHSIEVIVDGAHAFAQFPFQQSDLECDYYGTSLHKWVLAPIEHPQVRGDRHASGVAAQRDHRGAEFSRQHRRGT